MEQEKLFNSAFFNRLYDQMVQGSLHDTLEKAASLFGGAVVGKANAAPVPQMTSQEQLSGTKPEAPSFDQMWEQRGLPPRSIEDLLQQNPAQTPNFRQAPGRFGDPRKIVEG